MPSTRSGTIYNNTSIVASNRPIVSETETTVRKSPRLSTDTRRYSGRVHQGSLREIRPEFIEPITRPRRSNRTAFPAELVREFCDEKDTDSTSDYDSEDEEVQQYTRNSFFPVTLPKYEVNIDFDGASTAWRSNKRRVGESWVYKLNPRHPENIKMDIVDDAVASVASHVASRVANSVASRVKENRRGVSSSQY